MNCVAIELTNVTKKNEQDKINPPFPLPPHQRGKKVGF
jgi:hypothetical protein